MSDKTCKGNQIIMAENGTTQNLNSKQVKAINALLEQGTITAAADSAGVGRRTLERWLSSDPDFIQALNEAEQNALATASSRLNLAANRSIDTLLELLNSTREQIKIRAAESLLDFGLKYRQALDFDQRLARLETLMNSPIKES